MRFYGLGDAGDDGSFGASEAASGETDLTNTLSTTDAQAIFGNAGYGSTAMTTVTTDANGNTIAVPTGATSTTGTSSPVTAGSFSSLLTSLFGGPTATGAATVNSAGVVTGNTATSMVPILLLGVGAFLLLRKK